MDKNDEESQDDRESVNRDPEATSSKSNIKRKAEWFDIDDDHNTYLYVSGLPLNLTEEDFIDLMKKYGIIAKKTILGSPYNIKLYKNKDGSFKGDALCKYVRKESVELALTHLDGYQYDERHIIHCERAKFELKGSYDPTKKPRIDPKTKLKQKKSVEKLLSWDTKEPPEGKQKKVILKHMFTLEELIEEPGLILEIRDDVEERCTDIVAAPKRIDIYDTNPDGVIAVTFNQPEQAQACIESLNNSYYASRVVKAELWDGKTKYKSKETDEDAEKRLKKFERDIQESDNEDPDESGETDSANNAHDDTLKTGSEG